VQVSIGSRWSLSRCRAKNPGKCPALTHYYQMPTNYGDFGGKSGIYERLFYIVQVLNCRLKFSNPFFIAEYCYLKIFVEKKIKIFSTSESWPKI